MRRRTTHIEKQDGQDEQIKEHSQRADSWSYVVGEKGRNRVRVFERGGLIYLVYFADGRRVRRSLGHSDRDRAKQEAEAIAAKFGRTDGTPRGALTLDRLLTSYEKEVTPSKAPSTQSHDRRAFQLFRKAFGNDQRPDSLTVRDWSSYITRRRSGAIKPPRGAGRVRDRIIEQDCKLLLAVLNWAEQARFIERNPLRGLAVPKEHAPRRPVMTSELFAVVRTKAADLSLTAELFVCLLWFTGHRASSVRQLRWTDVDLEAKAVKWRADVDKIRHEHLNPIHSDLLPVLERGHAIAELTGETFVFPSGVRRNEAMTRQEGCKLWRAIAASAGILAGSRLGTHSFRRAFANRLRNVPMRELIDLGGWKSEKTVIGTYLQPDQDAQRAALEQL